MIRTECPACRERYRLHDELGGRWVSCRECATGFQVTLPGTERFRDFLARAPKPAHPPRKRTKRRRELPVAPAAPAREARARGATLRLVGLGASGLALMVLSSVVTFFVASAALG